MSSADVATLLDIHPRSLVRMRTRCDGPAFTKIRGRVYYDRADVLAHVSPTTAESRAFDETAPDQLPPPEPIRNRRLNRHNLKIAEMMARAGVDLDGVLSYLKCERRQLQHETVKALGRDIDAWKSETAYLVSKSAIGAALVGGQMSDRQHAGKILESSDPTQDEWGKKIGGSVDSVNALIERAIKHQATR